MRTSSYYDRIVGVMEELVRFTVLMRPHAAQLVDRYSERKEAGAPVNATGKGLRCSMTPHEAILPGPYCQRWMADIAAGADQSV